MKLIEKSNPPLTRCITNRCTTLGCVTPGHWGGETVPGRQYALQHGHRSLTPALLLHLQPNCADFLAIEIISKEIEHNSDNQRRGNNPYQKH